MRNLIIVNPRAWGMRARGLFAIVRDRLERALGELMVVVSHQPEDLSPQIETAIASGVERLIAVGGDGTNNSVVNALFSLPDQTRGRVAFGSVPMGTGSDWARSLGIPLDPVAAVDWLARAHPVACDLGLASYFDPGESNDPSRRFFLNIASAGVSGEVVRRVNRARRRTSTTFLLATISSLLRYKPRRVVVDANGERFYEGRCYLLAVANGQYFGRGMWVAPHALINDGLFDIVVVEGMPRRRILLALKTVYSGTHLHRHDVHSIRASNVRLFSEEGPLGLEFDGEEATGQSVEFKLIPRSLNVLIHPAVRHILKAC